MTGTFKICSGSSCCHSCGFSCGFNGGFSCSFSCGSSFGLSCGCSCGCCSGLSCGGGLKKEKKVQFSSSNNSQISNFTFILALLS